MPLYCRNTHRTNYAINAVALRTENIIWHPFTQHKHIENADDILVFDSAYGDYFQIKHTPRSETIDEHMKNQQVLYPAFDGSASWWTQGPPSSV